MKSLRGGAGEWRRWRRENWELPTDLQIECIFCFIKIIKLKWANTYLKLQTSFRVSSEEETDGGIISATGTEVK